MPKSLKTSRDVLGLILFGRVPAWAGEQTPRYFSLHTANPTDGNQTTGEVSYDGYRRQEVKVWDDIESTSYANHDLIQFPINVNADTAPITHICLGLESEGAGQVLYVGPVRRPKAIKFNSQPRIEAGEFVVSED